MNNFLILNDASLPFKNPEECRKNLFDFFKIVKKSEITRIYHLLENIENNWSNIAYAKNFTFDKWRNSLNRDQMRFINTFCTKCKLTLANEVTLADEFIKTDQDILFSYSDTEVKALGMVSLLKDQAHAISFCSNDKWQNNPINITKESNDDIEEISVANIYSENCINNFINKVTKDRQNNKQYLKNLQIQDNQDFPNIIFCESALRKLTLQSNYDHKKIISVLNTLDKTISNANNLSELKEKSGLDISGESRATLENPKYKRERIFKHPISNKDLLFQYHVKNFSNNKRMYIFPNWQERKICIGYFGEHLSTVKYS